VPTTIAGLRADPRFVLERDLGTRRCVRPGASALPMLVRGKERAFRAADVSELLSAEGWFKKGRQVVAGQHGSPVAVGEAEAAAMEAEAAAEAAAAAGGGLGGSALVGAEDERGEGRNEQQREADYNLAVEAMRASAPAACSAATPSPATPSAATPVAGSGADGGSTDRGANGLAGSGAGGGASGGAGSSEVGEAAGEGTRDQSSAQLPSGMASCRAWYYSGGNGRRPKSQQQQQQLRFPGLGFSAKPSRRATSGGGSSAPAKPLYGHWQTEPLSVPSAHSGIVPRNAYGVIDALSDAHLPHGTVHLRLPRIAQIAKSLGVSYAPARVGYDWQQGVATPRFDGIVVCAEAAAMLKEAHAQTTQQLLEIERRRIERAAIDDWRLLVRTIATRLRLQQTYGEGAEQARALATSAGSSGGGGGSHATARARGKAPEGASAANAQAARTGVNEEII
jgi:uncharacterized membrane protein YgcG